jgi:hypothetical protein
MLGFPKRATINDNERSFGELCVSPTEEETM